MTTKSKTITGILSALAIAGGIYVISPGSDGGVFKPDCSIYKPGDTLDMRGKNYSYAYFSGLKGDSLNPIVIDATGATLSAGFDFKDCKFWKVYGFTVDQKSVSVARVAVSVHGYSDHGEFYNFKIINSGYGFWIKNEHEDLSDTNVSNHVLNYFSIHDFEMGNLFSHGTYIGSTEYPNKTRPVTINGVNYYPNPSMVGNIKIYNGYIHNVGRNGLMVCLAKYGKNEIYNVKIDTTGRERNQDQQGSGLQFGGYTSVYAHNNNINHTLLWGIRSFGGDSVKIESNTITNSGSNTDTIIKWVQNIAIGQDASFIASGAKMYFSIKGNTLSAPGSDLVKNIQIWKGTGLFSDKNEICSNTGTIAVDAGVTYTTTCTDVVLTPIPDPIPTPVPSETYTGKKGYWIISNKRIYYKVYVYTDGSYQIKTGDYNWYKL